MPLTSFYVTGKLYLHRTLHLVGTQLLHQLEQEGIYVSTGSACSSKDKGSHVLSAMGLKSEEIEGAIRFSFCRDNTAEEMDTVVEKLKSYVSSQRKLRAAFRR